ncbi:MAG: hypothetical protein AAF620_18550, partial [Bacteroidota bacterium]
MKDSFYKYSVTFFVYPVMRSIRKRRVYERYQMWPDARTLGLDEYAQKYGETYTNMNAYWRYYQEKQMVNGVQVKRPQLIISGRVNGSYKRASRGSTGSGSWFQHHHYFEVSANGSFGAQASFVPTPKGP